jgi:ABC-type Mn2+/Zn2+ transport system permease subunit
MSSGEDLLEALFGGPGRLTIAESIFGILAAASVVLFVLKKRSSLILCLVSPEVARAAGIRVARLNLIYLEVFALTVALGLRYLGILLMGSLIIIPAATAKRLARSLSGMLLSAVLVAVLSTALGTYAATVFRRPAGPMTITVASGFFLLSLLRRRAA